MSSNINTPRREDSPQDAILQNFAIQRAPKDWCGTQITNDLNEADQAPIDDNMPVAFPIDQSYYPCVTQDGYMPTFGVPPTSPSKDFQGDGIMVGTRELIPRWAASKTNPTKLLYFVVRDGFRNDDDFSYIATSFQQAADEWNNHSLGIVISATTNRAEANFLVKYYKPTGKDGTIASAFFPNSVHDVLVYDKTLVEPFWRGVLRNSFLHEIGHIIGLRHEFANDPKSDTDPNTRETPANRFGSVSPHSVMSYDDVNNINELDTKDVKDFYALPNRSKINGVEIIDYVPKPFPQ